MRYMLLLCETDEMERELEAQGPEGRQQSLDRVVDWMERHRDKIVHRGARLAPPQTATTLRRKDDGELVVTDGPFVETVEFLGGYVEVDVADLDEAIRMVHDWPGCPTVEIRPIALQV
ncbi:MAG TPA: YciI family protein [Streptosporangiales bacterium]